MPRINIELDFLSHPKTVAIEPLAQLLFIRGLIYSAIHLTDGFIPMKAVRQLAFDLEDYARGSLMCSQSVLIKELLESKRWHKSRGGYHIHDYLEYQLSKAQVIEGLEKKRKAGSAGGQASALARAQAADQAEGKQMLNGISTDFNPNTNTNTNTNTKKREREAHPPKLVRGELPMPSDWSPKDNHLRFAKARGLDVQIEAQHFSGKASELEWVTKDWDRKFSNWMLQELKFRQRRPA